MVAETTATRVIFYKYHADYRQFHPITSFKMFASHAADTISGIWQ
jgi:hypothetical protein